MITGTVKNGVVVPDDATSLTDGARVELRIIPKLRSVSLNEIAGNGPTWDQAYPGEMTEALDALKRDKQEELRRSVERGEW